MRPENTARCVAGLSRRDVRILSGLPLTTPARTLLDLAAVVSPDELERVFAEAQVLRLVDARGIADQIERNPGRAGLRTLRALVDAGPPPARSEAERSFLRLVRAAGLPEPRVNTRVAGHRVDFLWPEQKLVVEVDGYAFHSHRARVRT